MGYTKYITMLLVFSSYISISSAVRSELHKRAIAKVFSIGSQEHSNYIQPLEIPPLVIEDVIRTRNKLPGITTGTMQLLKENVAVVVGTNQSVLDATQISLEDELKRTIIVNVNDHSMSKNTQEVLTLFKK